MTFKHDEHNRVHLSLDDIQNPDVLAKAMSHCAENGLTLHQARPADMQPHEHPPAGCIAMTVEEAGDFARFEALDKIARRMGGTAVVYRPIR